MGLSFAATLRASRLDAITTFAGNGALIRLYTGTKPTTAGGAATTLLAELVCGTPFAAAANSGTGQLTLSAITQDSSADNTGSAGWFRLVKSDGTTVVMEGTVGTSSADLIMPSTSITATQPVQITSFVITEANTWP